MSILISIVIISIFYFFVAIWSKQAEKDKTTNNQLKPKNEKANIRRTPGNGMHKAGTHGPAEV